MVVGNKVRDRTATSALRGSSPTRTQLPPLRATASPPRRTTGGALLGTCWPKPPGRTRVGSTLQPGACKRGNKHHADPPACFKNPQARRLRGLRWAGDGPKRPAVDRRSEVAPRAGRLRTSAARTDRWPRTPRTAPPNRPARSMWLAAMLRQRLPTTGPIGTGRAGPAPGPGRHTRPTARPPGAQPTRGPRLVFSHKILAANGMRQRPTECCTAPPPRRHRGPDPGRAAQAGDPLGASPPKLPPSSIRLADGQPALPWPRGPRGAPATGQLPGTKPAARA